MSNVPGVLRESSEIPTLNAHRPFDVRWVLTDFLPHSHRRRQLEWDTTVKLLRLPF